MLLQGKHAIAISLVIVLVPSTMFQTYDIISCDASCDNGHMTLYYLRNKRKREIKSNKIKYKGSSIL